MSYIPPRIVCTLRKYYNAFLTLEDYEKQYSKVGADGSMLADIISANDFLRTLNNRTFMQIAFRIFHDKMPAVRYSSLKILYNNFSSFKNRMEFRKQYLKLLKEYHPDGHTADDSFFQKLLELKDDFGEMEDDGYCLINHIVTGVADGILEYNHRAPKKKKQICLSYYTACTLCMKDSAEIAAACKGCHRIVGKKPKLEASCQNDVIDAPNCDSNPSPSDTGIFFQTSSSVNDSQIVKFLFHYNFFAIKVCQNGMTKTLKDDSGNEWTPLYFSMAEETPEFGEKAQSHYSKFAKHVIYDLWEVLGKPLNEIKINPKWGFELTVNDGILYFQIETLSGPRLFSQEIVIAAFLKNMKLRVESNLNVTVKDVEISANFELTESQKTIFVKAAAKIGFEILSFV